MPASKPQVDDIDTSETQSSAQEEVLSPKRHASDSAGHHRDEAMQHSNQASILDSHQAAGLNAEAKEAESGSQFQPSPTQASSGDPAGSLPGHLQQR